MPYCITRRVVAQSCTVGNAYPGEPRCGQAICILEGPLVASMERC